MGFLERSPLAHDGNGEPKEDCSEHHNAVDPSPPGKLDPLDVASTNPETNKYTYATGSTLA